MILLVDGNNLLHRVCHALGVFRGTWQGDHGGAFGFIKALHGVLERFPRVTETVVAWDGGSSARRRARLHTYRLREREPRHTSILRVQEEEITTLCGPLGIATLKQVPGEADDLIAFFARSAGPGREVVILSEDKDMIQCVTNHVSVFRPMAEDTTPGRGLITPETFASVMRVDFPVFGWLPYRALTGDGSDKINGVPQLGPKTAEAIVRLWCSTDARGGHVLPTASQLVACATAIARHGLSRAWHATKHAPLIERNLDLMDLTREDLGPAAGALLYGQSNGPPNHPLVQHLLGLWSFKSILQNYPQWIKAFDRRPLRTAMKHPGTGA